MNPPKKALAKSAAKKPVVPIDEYVGNECSTNYWVKLGLVRQELAALKPIAKLFKDAKCQTTGNALHLVVTTALMHWDMLEPYVFSDQEYCKAEGFRSMENFREAVNGRKIPELQPDGRAAGAKRGKKVKPFFEINMSQNDRADLKEIANAMGLDIRNFISHAILERKLAYRKMLETAKANHLEPRQFFDLAQCSGNSVN